jgi:transcriptional regulator with XRE-family HTH domain
MQKRKDYFGGTCDDSAALTLWLENLKISHKQLAKEAGVNVEVVIGMQLGTDETEENCRKVWAAIDHLRANTPEQKKIDAAIAVFKKREAEREKKPLGDLIQKNLDGPLWNGKAFKKQRTESGITQAQLVGPSGYSQTYISQIESGDRPFTEDSGTALWNALFVLQTEDYIKSGKLSADAAKFEAAGPFGMFGMLDKMLFDPATMAKQKDEYIAALEKQVELQKDHIESLTATAATLTANNAALLKSTRMDEVIELFSRLEKLENWDQIKYLLGRIDAMEQKYLDLCRLNGLRTEALVKTEEADALQAELTRKHKPDED